MEELLLNIVAMCNEGYQVSEIKNRIAEYGFNPMQMNEFIKRLEKAEVSVWGQEKNKALINNLKNDTSISGKFQTELDYSTPGLNPQPVPQTSKTDLICDNKLLQTLHAEFDGTNWESVTLEIFLDFMRVEPIGQIQVIGGNKVFANWLRENIEFERNKKLVPNMGNWFKKLMNKNINYSTLVTKE
jgi:hypothetical protein